MFYAKIIHVYFFISLLIENGNGVIDYRWLGYAISYSQLTFLFRFFIRLNCYLAK